MTAVEMRMLARMIAEEISISRDTDAVVIRDLDGHPRRSFASDYRRTLWGVLDQQAREADDALGDMVKK